MGFGCSASWISSAVNPSPTGGLEAGVACVRFAGDVLGVGRKNCCIEASPLPEPPILGGVLVCRIDADEVEKEEVGREKKSRAEQSRGGGQPTAVMGRNAVRDFLSGVFDLHSSFLIFSTLAALGQGAYAHAMSSSQRIQLFRYRPQLHRMASCVSLSSPRPLAGPVGSRLVAFTNFRPDTVSAPLLNAQHKHSRRHSPGASCGSLRLSASTVRVFLQNLRVMYAFQVESRQALAASARSCRALLSHGSPASSPFTIDSSSPLGAIAIMQVFCAASATLSHVSISKGPAD